MGGNAEGRTHGVLDCHKLRHRWFDRQRVNTNAIV